MAFYEPEVMSGIGWHGLNMNRYKATILPLIGKKIDKSCLIHHMPNNYVNAISDFGNLPMTKVPSKNLINFKEKKLLKLFKLFLFQFRSLKKII